VAGIPDNVLLQVLREDSVNGDVSAFSSPSDKGASVEGLDQVFAALDLGTLPGLLE
jgi:hypothetical protein